MHQPSAVEVTALAKQVNPIWCGSLCRRGQLLWREFFYLSGHSIPNFDRMEGSPICKQVLPAGGLLRPTHPNCLSTASQARATHHPPAAPGPCTHPPH